MNNKIFCIGGHKCGTFSLHNFFINCGFKSIHGGFWATEKNEFKLNKFDCFSDHFAEFDFAIERFKYLINRYPNAKFILNYRHIKPYVKSIYKHVAFGTENGGWWNLQNTPGDCIAKRVIHTHNTNLFIYNYMKSNNMMDQLLIIDITSGKNKENTILLKKFLCINNNIKLENNRHFSSDDKEKIDMAFNKHIRHYEIALEKTSHICDKEYSDYLDKEYQRSLDRINKKIMALQT